MSDVTWWKIKNQNLALSVRNVGFDLTVFNDYNAEVQEEVQRLAIKESLEEIENSYLEVSGKNLKDINKGVYVICLSDPFTIRYAEKLSNIIYIGQGNVWTRLKSHYEKSLFRFMQSLSGTNFDFYISEPKMTGRGNRTHYYKHVEHELLDRFSKSIGGGDREFPLLNTNAGSNKKLKCGKGWDKPLKLSGKKPQWALEPTKFWDFEKLD